MTIILAVVLALIVMNALAFTQFRRDKRLAQAGERRISEADLLSLALLGGTPGAYLARHMFRHKTRKQPFSTYLHLIAVVQAGLAIGFIWPMG